ncbi:MAG: methyl-accepting chemotaxis protein [Formivibrio sp.]|nr:methyl-accepting chemotaxis protein [Formivibrio sp.]
MKLSSLMRGGIRKKLFLASTALVVIPILSITLLLDYSLTKKSETDFLARAGGEMKQVDNVITVLLDNATQNLELMSAHPATQKIDESINNYANKTSDTELKGLERGPLETELFNHFKLIGDTHPDYIELYMGTKFGGFITNDQTKVKGGYDPRKRPWYANAIEQKGKATIAKAYLSTNGENVTAVVKSFTDASGEVLFVSGIDISLKRLTEVMNSIHIGESGYLMLVEGDGTVLTHPTNKDLIAKNIDTLNIPELTDAVKNNAETFRFKHDGVEKEGKVLAASRGGWKIIGVIDRSEILSSARHLMGIIALVGLAFTAAAILIAYAMANRITSGIRRINSIMQEIAQGGGDLTRRIEIDGDDEIAETARFFNIFLEHLRSLFHDIRSEAAQLTEGVHSVNNVLGQLAEDFRDLADQSSSNAATIEEITVSIAHIAGNADEADSLVKDASTLSEESAHTVSEVAQRAGQSANEVEGLAALLEELNQRSQEISGITQVIKEIADQTNLLALNAAIEAARAGEQGRGFAVVADEVRKLAERTGSATLQITRMTEGIRDQTNTAVNDMKHTLASAQAGVVYSESAAEKIRVIHGNMGAARSKMEEIALSTREEQTATTAMAQSAEHITTRMQKSESELQEATTTLQDLDRLAEGLQDKFSSFRM